MTVTAPESPFAVGDLVQLALTWGTQMRLKCVVCKRYLGSRKGLVECKCGAEYSYDEQSSKHRIERIPL